MLTKNETGGRRLLEKLKRKVVGCGVWLGNHAAFECAFMIFMGLAVLGETKSYSLALGVALPIYWLNRKAKRVRQLVRCVEINLSFWDAAHSDNDRGLAKTMREMCRASLPNTGYEPRDCGEKSKQ